MADTLDTLAYAVELLAYLVAICAALAAVLPKSNAPWRKFLDTLAINLGNAKNDVAAAEKVAKAVQAVKPPTPPKRWQEKIRR